MADVSSLVDMVIFGITVSLGAGALFGSVVAFVRTSF